MLTMNCTLLSPQLWRTKSQGHCPSDDLEPGGHQIDHPVLEVTPPLPCRQNRINRWLPGLNRAESAHLTSVRLFLSGPALSAAEPRFWRLLPQESTLLCWLKSLGRAASEGLGHGVFLFSAGFIFPFLESAELQQFRRTLTANYHPAGCCHNRPA